MFNRGMRIHAPFWMRVGIAVLIAVPTLLLFCGLALAQTPTPWPSPTPIVTDDYVIQQSVTYGEGGVMVGLLFVGGLLLLDVFVRLSERLTDR